MSLTEHIPLPESLINRLPYARKPGSWCERWTLSLYPGNKILAEFDTEAETRAAVAEFKVRIAVYRVLTR